MGALWQFAPITLLSAELLFFLVRNKEIMVVLKTAAQRTKIEQLQVNRGLVRSLLLEILLFVPASAALMLILIRPFILPHISSDKDVILATHGLMGVTSYGFPFGTVRAVMTRLSLKLLTEFAAVTLQHSGSTESIDDLRALRDVKAADNVP